MKLRTILFSTDFSTCSDAALHMATSLARDAGAKLVIVHVEEPPMVYGYGAAYYGALDPGAEQQREMLERLVPDDPDVPTEHRLIQGAPAEAIVRVADEESADLIVMGTHGRTGITRVLMGSVAEDVVRHAHCPVLTFKQPHGQPQEKQEE